MPRKRRRPPGRRVDRPTDLERLVELVRLVADDPTTTYRPRRTRSMSYLHAAERARTRRRRIDAWEGSLELQSEL